MKNNLVLPIIDSKTRELTLLHFRKQPYKPKKKPALILNLKRDLKPGWLLTILAQIDRCLWGRWDYWALCQAVPSSCLDAVEDGANASHSGEQKTRKLTQICN
jgi:hypothetical protein